MNTSHRRSAVTVLSISGLALGLCLGLTGCASDASSSDADAGMATTEPASNPSDMSADGTGGGGMGASEGTTSSGNPFVILSDDPESRVKSPWATGGSATGGGGTSVQQGDTGSGVTSGGASGPGASATPTQDNNWIEPATTDTTITAAATADNDWTTEPVQAADDAANDWVETATDDAMADAWTTDTADEVADATTNDWAESDLANDQLADAVDDAEASMDGLMEDGMEEADEMLANIDPFIMPADPLNDESRALAYQAAGYMVGAFSSAEQADENEAYYNVLLRVTPIWASRTDGPWLYVEQALASAADRPYRQRVYRMTALPSGKVRSEVFTFASDPASVAGAWKNPVLFDSMSPADLGSREGCAVELAYLEEDDLFTGSTVGTGCVSTLNGAAYATSVVTLRDGELTSWDRGFDAQGDQVWGAEDGAYVFIREN
ncbi:MAG: chromophore lyase CpcT/CpeT [Planctomycetota bacterium]